MSWTLLALAAPLFWSISNLFDKFALGKLTRGVADFIFFGSIGNFLLFLVILAVRGFPVLPTHLIFYGVLGGFVLNYGYIFYSKALAKSDASRVVPLYQAIPVFVLILGYFFFEEFLTTTQFIGFVFIFIGGLVLSIEKQVFKGARVSNAFWLMLVSSFLVAAYTVFLDQVLENSDFWTAVTYDSLGFAMAGVSLFGYGPWRREIIAGLKEARPKKYGLFFLNDGVDLAGHVFFKFALLAAPAASLVSVLLGIQPFLVLLLGFISTLLIPNIIKEDITLKTLINKSSGIIIIFLGVLFIFLF